MRVTLVHKLEARAARERALCRGGGLRVLEIGDLCVAAGVAGWPAVARGSVIEGERDPFPPTRYDR
jgi:hypothetical protein